MRFTARLLFGVFVLGVAVPFSIVTIYIRTKATFTLEEQRSTWTEDRLDILGTALSNLLDRVTVLEKENSQLLKNTKNQTQQLKDLTEKTISGLGAITSRIRTDEEPSEPSISKALLSPWQQRIKQQCKRHKRPTRLDVIRPKWFDPFLVDDKYKVIYCQVPKVASTTWRRIFIIMSGKVGTSDPMAMRPDDAQHNYDKFLTHMSALSEKQIRYRLRTYFKFLFVREPFERILSAFRNKFDIPYKPGNYFHDGIGRRIIKRYRANHSEIEKEDNRVKFPEFVDYLVDTDSGIGTNVHWKQYYKLCLPCEVDYDFIGRLDSIQEDSNFIIQKIGLKNVTKFPNRQESGYRKKVTDNSLKEYYSKISKSKLQQLWKTYQEDFAIFNYTIPEDVKALMK